MQATKNTQAHMQDAKSTQTHMQAADVQATVIMIIM